MDKAISDWEIKARDEDLGRCTAQGTRDFRNTTVRGTRVDRCWIWGRECDKQAADRFCVMNGYGEAVVYEWERVRPTLILGNGQGCDQENCGGFTLIRCQGELRK